MTTRQLVSLFSIAWIASGCGITVAWRVPHTPTLQNAWNILVTPSVEELSGHLRRVCGGIPESVCPIPRPLPDITAFSGVEIDRIARLEVELDDGLAREVPLAMFGTTLTQNGFPQILAATKEENRAIFGARANRPD